MVFHVKNAHIHKKIVPTVVVFLMIILALSLIFAQMSLVCAQEGEASLTGTTSDNGVNSDADEFYETLDIGIEVNVTAAGTFKVEVAGLYDSESIFIDVSNENSTTLETGVHVVYVSLDGTSSSSQHSIPSTFPASASTMNLTHCLILCLTSPCLQAIFSAISGFCLQPSPKQSMMREWIPMTMDIMITLIWA